MMQGLHNPEAADAEGQIGEGKKKKNSQPIIHGYVFLKSHGCGLLSTEK